MKRKKMNNEKGSLFIFLLCYEELFSILLSLWEQLHCLKTWTRYVVKRYLCLVAILWYCPKKCVTIIFHIFHFVQNYLLSFQPLH